METLSKFKDKTWRINHLYKIIDKNSQLVQFKEFPIQKLVREDQSRIKQILKARQMGITAGATIDLFDDVIWTPNMTGMVLCHKSQDRDKIFNKVQMAYKEMNPSIRPKIDRGGGSKFELRFPEINSKIFIDIENRGDTIHRIHISEYAFCEPERIRATLGAVTPDAKICYESTPNGMSGDFYRHWINPKSQRKKLFFPWFYQKEYSMDSSHIKKLTKNEIEFTKKVKRIFDLDITKDQIAWRRAQIEEHGDMFKQEFPEDDHSCFLASGACPVDQEFISLLMRDLPEPLIDETDYTQWKAYDKDKRYIIGADVAQGVKSDFSVADVFCIDTNEQVAQFRSNNIKPFAFGKKLVDIAEMFHAGGRPWPQIGVELNNHGHAVNGYLYNSAGYSNLYFSKDDTPGWLTNSITRPKMIDTFIDSLESQAVKINSAITLGECLTLVDNGGKIEATEGEHDDTIISAAIAIQLLIKSAPSDIYDNLSKKILL